MYKYIEIWAKDAIETLKLYSLIARKLPGKFGLKNSACCASDNWFLSAGAKQGRTTMVQ